MAALVDILFPLSSSPGASAQESSGRLINTYAEPRGEKEGPVWRRSPGMTQLAASIYTGYRGAALIKNLLYVAKSGQLVAYDSVGNETVIGALAGTLPVTIARNNLNPTPQVAIVTENGAFVSSGGSAPAAWPDADLPVPNSVSLQDGYFFFTIGDGRVFASGINATSIDPLAFVTIQSRASDSLLRGIPYKGVMLFLKTSSIEAWNDTANAAPAFPYSRLQVIDRGLLSANAAAGHQDGFGIFMWVADDGGVYRFSDATSFGLQKVSGPDVDRAIASVANPSTLAAGCYVDRGRSVWFLSNTAAPYWTWEFNTNTEKWNERQSYQPNNNTGAPFSIWRGMGGTFAFGKWVLGDFLGGTMGYIDATNQQEFGQPVRMRMESREVQDFPNRQRVGRADFNWVTGVGIVAGTANQQNPQVEFSWSDDGGTKWSNPVLRTLGAQAKAGQRVTVLNAGTAGPRGRRWRMDVADPVYSGFINAKQSSDPRAY